MAKEKTLTKAALLELLEKERARLDHVLADHEFTEGKLKKSEKEVETLKKSLGEAVKAEEEVHRLHQALQDDYNLLKESSESRIEELEAQVEILKSSRVSVDPDRRVTDAYALVQQLKTLPMVQASFLLQTSMDLVLAVLDDSSLPTYAFTFVKGLDEAPVKDPVLPTEKQLDGSSEQKYRLKIVAYDRDNGKSVVARVSKIFGIQLPEAVKLLSRLPLTTSPMDRQEAFALRDSLTQDGAQVKIV